ncbi:MAG TPA: hypothetical protein EYQ07_04855 [Candidatus Poseidoniales archaeon]|nr:MAG: hypothetical protein CXT64_00890 [Euryarchaeota archaeon]HIE81838.1 hypothetical protein [Candidatus Poseidoniales archaeon]HIL50474.1 hypothetical protein [Candidatus Poseidoniales archaeon]
MAIPTTQDELLLILRDFSTDTFPTLMAIIAIAAYSGFVFMFYRLLAKRDLLTLDLKRYEDSMTGRIRVFFRSLLFVAQYVLLIPILIGFWTVVMATILTLLSDSSDHSRNAMIATSVVGAVRILAYWTEDLSRDVAKMLPFAVLGVFLVGSTSVNFSEFEALYSNLPELADAYLNSLILLSILETVLRVGHVVKDLFGGQRRVKKKLKEISKETGRKTADIREDMLDDGILNYSSRTDSKSNGKS